MKNEKTPVIFIGGMGRSGSTLLDLLMGQAPNAVSVGEFRFIWNRGIKQNQLCGCGQPFMSCKFWNSVLEEAFGSLDSSIISETAHLHDDICKTNNLLSIMYPNLRTRKFDADLSAIKNSIGITVSAILKVSGAKYLIDSSKHPIQGFMLNQIPNLDLRPIHLVRDPRAVAYSWKKTKKRPEIHWKSEDMPKFNIMHSAKRWYEFNVFTAILASRTTGSCRILYEDFCEQPQEVFQSICEKLNLEELVYDLSSASYGMEAHTISGNPIRFKSGPISILQDDAWVSKIGKLDKAILTTLCLPGLMKYGYPLSPNS